MTDTARGSDRPIPSAPPPDGIGAPAGTARQVPVAARRRHGAVIGALVLRRAGRSGALWGLIFGAFVAAQLLAYAATYRTQSARDGLAGAYGNNAGLDALLGQARAINTTAGYAEWRLLGVLSIVGAIWGLLTSTRLIRGDEESGRSDLLLCGPTTRRRAAGQAMAGLAGGLMALFALTATGMALAGRSHAIGLSVQRSLFFSATLVASAALFLAVGALTSQLASTRRHAAALAGTIFGVAFAVRMTADSDARLSWLIWMSPLGWIERIRALTDPDPLALLAVVALVAVLGGAAAYLAGARDVGAASLPARTASRPRPRLLGGPAGLGLRLTRATAIGWLSGVTALSVLMGSLARGSTQDVTGSVGIRASVGRLGGNGGLVDVYLGLAFLVVALVITLVAAGQMTAIRDEEAQGRLENLLARPVGRGSWLAGRLGLCVLLVVISGVVAGLGTWAGAALQHSGVSLGTLLLAGLNAAPPALFLVGLGAIVFGAWPRRTSAVIYSYLAWSFLVEFFGAIVRTDHWIMDTSIIFHMVPAPAAGPDWASVAVIAGLGAAGAVAGVALFRRRDLAAA